MSNITVNCQSAPPQFAYAANTIGNISEYTVAATGALSLTGRYPTISSGPYSIAVDPSGQFVYVGNIRGGVEAYSIDQASGALAEITGSPFQDVHTLNAKLRRADKSRKRVGLHDRCRFGSVDTPHWFAAPTRHARGRHFFEPRATIRLLHLQFRWTRGAAVVFRGHDYRCFVQYREPYLSGSGGNRRHRRRSDGKIRLRANGPSADLRDRQLPGNEIAELCHYLFLIVNKSPSFS